MSNTDILLRSGAAADAGAIYDLARGLATSFVVTEPEFLASLDDVLSSDRACLLVAESGGRALGYLLGFSRPAFYANGPVGWIEELMVDEGSRRRGIGRRLVAAFEEWARARGARLISLATRRADAFYVALGYEASATYFKKRF